MLSTNLIAGFLNFNVSKTVGGIKLLTIINDQIGYSNFKISSTREGTKLILCTQLTA